MKKNAGAALAALFAITAAAPMAQAQSAPSQEPIVNGPAIPGICVLSKDGLIGASTVGKYAVTRLNQLAQQAQSEIAAQQTSLQNDEKAFEAQRSSLTSDQVQQRGVVLAGRERDLERLVDLRRQEMSATQQKAFNRVLSEADPIVRQVYQSRRCSILLDGQAVIFSAPAMDLTGSVIEGLNAKITQFEFEREHLDQNAPAAGR